MDLERMLSHLDGVVVAKTIVQLFIIVYAVLWVWSRIVGTQAERLVKGVIILSVIFLAVLFRRFYDHHLLAATFNSCGSDGNGGCLPARNPPWAWLSGQGKNAENGPVIGG